ncbi:MAG: STAS domain-containing protein [Saccharothrix sp.]|nr:STAS domain-containing protein [Saccharothrix sp.]
MVEVVGEIDMACEEPVRTTVGEQLDRRPRGLVLDLNAVEFFGSTGIQLLVEAVAGAQRLGVPLAVATARRAVLRPLEITLVDQVVDVHPTLPDALAALRTQGRSGSRHSAADAG